VTIAVQRDGQLWKTDAAPEELVGLLRPGDELRLRVGTDSSSQRWATVEGLQSAEGTAHWRPYYEGEVPRDGWLPFAVQITAEGETSLRLSVCRGNDASESSCQDATVVF